MLGMTVSPADCALALCIPLGKEDFFQDLEAGREKDFASGLRRLVPRGNADELYAWYRHKLAAFAESVADEAARSGVTVYRRTPLERIPSLCREHAVVTVVAHWKYLLLKAGDVLDLQRFRDCLAASPTTVPRRDGGSQIEDRQDSLARLMRMDAAIVSARDEIELAAAISAFLARTKAYHLFSEQDGVTELSQRGTAGPTRVHLEESYPGCFRPGQCLELSDRLCTVWEFIDCVDQESETLFDFTVCNSVVLAETLHRHRPKTNSICLVAPAKADHRMLMYRWIIRQLAECPQPYEDAAARVHLALAAELRRRSQPGLQALGAATDQGMSHSASPSMEQELE